MIDLRAVVLASGGVVVTPTSEANRLFYMKKLHEFKHGNPNQVCASPEAAALALLVEHAITNKTYLTYSDASSVGEYDIIVVFNASGDPSFGFLRNNDGELVVQVSTHDGLADKYI